MSILIIHTQEQSNSCLPQLIAAAQQLDQHCDCLLIGPDADTSKLSGIETIHHHTDPQLQHPSAATIALIISEYHEQYTHLLCHSDTYSKDYLPYFCGKANLPMISDVRSIINTHTYTRSIYAGNAIQSVKNTAPIQVLSIRTIYFEAIKDTKEPTLTTISKQYPPSDPLFISESTPNSDLPDLINAETVISGGRGLGSKDNFDQIYALAKHFGAAVGASRAAVDAGYIGNEHQVGQTGKIIAPKVYISFGISGAVQHLSGMKDSQIIIAVDKNPEAPIFKIADYSYCGDLFDAISALSKRSLNR